MDAHRIALPGTDWTAWRDAVLRSAGFPATGLDRFRTPEAAAAADADDPAYEEIHAEAARFVGREVYALAGESLFREAVAWQSANALGVLDRLRRGGPEETRTGARNRHKRRRAEELAVRYWQRYCGKNETVGFFGPVTWCRLDDVPAAAVVRPGPALLRTRQVYVEHWALQALGDALATDPAVRRWLPAGLPPQLARRGRTVLRPTQPPVTLTPVEVALLERCDGRRPLALIAADLVADPEVGLRRETDVELVLDGLVHRGLAWWGVDLPMHPRAEVGLRDVLAAIGDPEPKERACAAFDRLLAARDGVAAAAGDPDALAAALARLAAEFTELTGADPHRRAGQAYAGRTVCYEETTRDVDVTIGGPVLRELAGPMRVLLAAARWLTSAIAGAYETALRDLYDDLAGSDDSVPLGQLWYLAQGLLFGPDNRPADAVAADFAGRWARLLHLDAATGPVVVASDDLLDAAAELFPAAAPGWSGARIHSPDLHVCARDAEALAGGDFHLVLGELHAAWATVDNVVFVLRHPDQPALREGLRADLGPDRVRPLFPTDWPRHTGRVAFALEHPDDVQLSFAAAPGADRDRLLPITAVVVEPAADGALVARADDGRTWPLIEVFAQLVAMHAGEAFKLVAGGRHTPRVTIDRLTVARETWRGTVGETGMTTAPYGAERYRAARRWRARLGLPERVYVSIGTEIKPVYVDFASTAYVASLGSMLRAARAEGGDGVRVTVSEMLPTPAEAWLADADGERYFTELRMQLVDPVPASFGGAS